MILLCPGYCLPGFKTSVPLHDEWRPSHRDAISNPPNIYRYMNIYKTLVACFIEHLAEQRGNRTYHFLNCLETTA